MRAALREPLHRPALRDSVRSGARHLGFEPTETVEDAIARAEALHGPQASIAWVRYPQGFIRQ